MKKIFISLIIAVISLNLTAQKIHTVAWYNWSNPISYQLSPSPYITGYGFYSDSLSKAFDGTIFYVCNEEYFPINTWADYYYWYVNRYWFNFIDPELYEYFYNIKDDYQMARYIAGNSYQMRYYPSRIYIAFGNRKIDINRLDVDSRYLASNDRKIAKLRKQIKTTKEPSKNQYGIVVKNSTFKKLTNTNNQYTRRNTSVKNYPMKDIKEEVKHNSYEKNTFKSNTVYRTPVYNNIKTNSNSSSGTSKNKVSKAPKQK